MNFTVYWFADSGIILWIQGRIEDFLKASEHLPGKQLNSY